MKGGKKLDLKQVETNYKNKKKQDRAHETAGVSYSCQSVKVPIQLWCPYVFVAYFIRD
jgi:hypothetical protein